MFSHSTYCILCECVSCIVLCVIMYACQDTRCFSVLLCIQLYTLTYKIIHAKGIQNMIYTRYKLGLYKLNDLAMSNTRKFFVV